jgi:hypothetical protein
MLWQVQYATVGMVEGSRICEEATLLKGVWHLHEELEEKYLPG